MSQLLVNIQVFLSVVLTVLLVIMKYTNVLKQQQSKSDHKIRANNFLLSF